MRKRVGSEHFSPFCENVSWKERSTAKSRSGTSSKTMFGRLAAELEGDSFQVRVGGAVQDAAPDSRAAGE